MITHVAIRFGGKVWSLPAPNRHHHVIRMIVDETGVSSVDSSGEDQGFLDDDGNYLTREQALQHCIECEWLDSKEDIIGGVLTSEDLW